MREELPLLNDLYKKHSITKALNIVNDPCHTLWNAYQISGRSGRFITVHSKTGRYKKSFVPATSRIYAFYTSVNIMAVRRYVREVRK